MSIDPDYAVFSNQGNRALMPREDTAAKVEWTDTKRVAVHAATGSVSVHYIAEPNKGKPELRSAIAIDGLEDLKELRRVVNRAINLQRKFDKAEAKRNDA